MLKRKVGVFSTRSPHRPNPIGACVRTTRISLHIILIFYT